jgi:hypothetical protein
VSEPAIGIVAALLVLLGAMADPRLSVAVAVGSLLTMVGCRWYVTRGTGANR